MLLYFLLSYYICSSNLHNLLYFCRLFRIFLLEVCLSMWDLLVETRHWRVNFTRKILESKRILGAKWVKTLSYLVYSERGFAKWDLWLTLPQGCAFQQSCIKIKINRNFLFAHFFVVLQKVLWRPLKHSWNLFRHHKKMWK